MSAITLGKSCSSLYCKHKAAPGQLAAAAVIVILQSLELDVSDTKHTCRYDITESWPEVLASAADLASASVTAAAVLFAMVAI